jgi:hypothetical protein
MGKHTHHHHFYRKKLQNVHISKVHSNTHIITVEL